MSHGMCKPQALTDWCMRRIQSENSLTVANRRHMIRARWALDTTGCKPRVIILKQYQSILFRFYGMIRPQKTNETLVRQMHSLKRNDSPEEEQQWHPILDRILLVYT